MRDNDYNYLQHNFSVLIYLDKNGFQIAVYKTELQSTGGYNRWFVTTTEGFLSSVLYDTELDSVTNLSKGNSREFSDSKIRRMDNFLHQLSDLYYKDDWSDEDNLTFKIVGKALELFVDETQEEIMKDKNVTLTFNCHYAFVLHFGCMQADFEERIILPLFIQANLISSNDHPSRLHVFTELDHLVQSMRSYPHAYQFTNNNNFNASRHFKKKNRYIVSKLDITNKDESYWSGHVFEFVETTKFGDQIGTSFQSTLGPRFIQGLPAAENKIKIGTELTGALFDLLQSNHDSQQIPTEVDMENIMALIIDYFYPKEILDRYILNNDKKSSNNDEAKLDIQLLDYYNKAISRNNSFRTTQEILLSLEQQTLIKNVSVLDIYNKLLAPIQSHIKKNIEVFTASSGTFVHSVNKLYVVPVLKRTPDIRKTWVGIWVERCVTRVLLHYEKSINYILVIRWTDDFVVYADCEEKDKDDEDYEEENDDDEGYKEEDEDNGDDHEEDEDDEGDEEVEAGDNSVTDSGNNNNYKISQNFSSGSIYYVGYEVLDYAWNQLTDRIQNANMGEPPYFLNPQPEDISPQQVISSAKTANGREQHQQSNNNSRSAEELLPILQEKFDVDLELKAYYLQAQLYQEHIQLTLNQVVKVASNEEDATSFVVEERIISIENIYNSFCKRILNCGGLLLDNQFCDIHHQQSAKSNNNRVQQKALATIALYNTKKDDYKEVSTNLKEHFNEIIRSTIDDGLDFDAVKRMVKLNSVCGCRLSISMRDFIDVALILTITEITAAISGALVNKQDFGRYKINYVFLLLGGLFEEDKDSAPSSAFMMKILATVVQEALEDSNQEKETQPNCFYCTDTIESLYIKAQQKRLQKKILKPPINSFPLLSITTISSRKGKLCPVSKERYGFCLSFAERLDIFQQVDGTTDKLECATDAIHSPITIVQNGQYIPIDGIRKVFYLKFLGEFNYKVPRIDIYKIHHTLHLQKHSSPDDSGHNLGGSSDSWDLIYQENFMVNMEEHIGNRFSSSTKDPIFPIYFSIKYDHPDSLLKILMSLADVEKGRGITMNIYHPLTLAYF